MKQHERDPLLRRIETDLRQALLDLEAKHGLTYAEVFLLLINIQQSYARAAVIGERRQEATS